MSIIALEQLLDSIADSSAANEWNAALRAAIRESSHVLLSMGALSDADEFYNTVTRVADEGFDYEELSRKASQLLKGKDQWLAIDEGFNAAECAKWRGAYALGLAVGMRLAAGAR